MLTLQGQYDIKFSKERGVAMVEKALQARNLPALLTMDDGSAVTAENWEVRRQELIACLSENLFG